MSYNTDHPFNGFANEVLENVIKDELDSKLAMDRFMTPDYSLTTADGLTKTIHRYHITDDSEVQPLERGEDNDKFIDAAFDTYKYTAQRYQGTISYADDDLLQDSAYVEAKLKYLAQEFQNSWDDRAINEFKKSENIVPITSGLTLGDFADMLNAYTKVHETTEGLFWLIDRNLEAAVIKSLGSELKYVEDFIRVGSRGAILGCPVFFRKNLPAGLVFLASRDGVKAMIKKDVNVESDRDIGKKTNRSVISSYAIIALVDETRVVVGGVAQEVDASITTATKATKTIAGAAETGATVTAYVNGEYAGSDVASDNEYSITAVENLVAGDSVKVIAEVPGKVNSIARTTVAE